MGSSLTIGQPDASKIFLLEIEYEQTFNLSFEIWLWSFYRFRSMF